MAHLREGSRVATRLPELVKLLGIPLPTRRHDGPAAGITHEVLQPGFSVQILYFGDRLIQIVCSTDPHQGSVSKLLEQVVALHPDPPKGNNKRESI